MFLKRETSTTAVKPKPNPLLTSMASNILTSVYQTEDSWPQSFIKVKFWINSKSLGSSSFLLSQALFSKSITCVTELLKPLKIEVEKVANFNHGLFKFSLFAFVQEVYSRHGLSVTFTTSCHFLQNLCIIYSTGFGDLFLRRYVKYNLTNS